VNNLYCFLQNYRLLSEEVIPFPPTEVKEPRNKFIGKKGLFIENGG